MNRSFTFVAAAVLLAGCSEAPRPSRPKATVAPPSTVAPPAAVAPPESASARASTPVVRDSTWVVVDGPTLVAFYVLPTHADSAGEVDAALDDYGYYLAEADSSLRVLGFRVQVVPSRTIHLVAGRDTAVFTVPPDSADIGYYFVAPGRAPAVFYGVQVGDQLVAEARAYLRPGTPRP